MSRKLIIIGELNIKHILPFLFAIIQIILYLFNRYFPGDIQNMVLDLFSTSFGVLSVEFIPHI